MTGTSDSGLIVQGPEATSALSKVLWKAVGRLDAWQSGNGWTGWDPYDLRGTPLMLRLVRSRSNIPAKLVIGLLTRVSRAFPQVTRQLLGVRPVVNAKGMGLFLAAYSDLHRSSGKARYLRKASECAEWLLANRGKDYEGMNWGYPFDWNSVRFIPKGTPSSVVTSIVGDGFFRLYRATGERKHLEVCREICGFFLKSLQVTYDQDNVTCYSYTPIDDYQVHNANLFVAEFLARVGKESGDRQLVQRGIRCGRFALKEQFPKGNIPYWGLSQTDSHSGGVIRNDHYHSGFEIRMLYGLWLHTALEEFRNGYERYFQWYRRHLFREDGLPKLRVDSFYPINIHTCAEAILCLATLSASHPGLLSETGTVVRWVIRKMEFKPGQYTHIISRRPVRGEWRSDIPMIRWGQAWMLRAYAETLNAIRRQTESHR